MRRAAAAAIALLMLPSCAHAQSEAEPDAPIVQATARVIAEALAPNDAGAWAYTWDAVSIRISRHMHWHVPRPDPIDRPPDALTQRNGWIGAGGGNVGVSAIGLDDRVIKLTFDVDDFHTLHLVQALQAQGVEVSFQSEDESSSEYLVTPPGREGGMLTSTRICTSSESRAAQRCHDELTLAFELP